MFSNGVKSKTTLSNGCYGKLSLEETQYVEEVLERFDFKLAAKVCGYGESGYELNVAMAEKLKDEALYLLVLAIEENASLGTDVSFLSTGPFRARFCRSKSRLDLELISIRSVNGDHFF